MGSSISSLVAELVLQELEKVSFDHYEPAFWRRYVDVTFVIIERSRLADFQDLLNGIFTDIQFTREEEHAEQLPFLDVLVTRTLNGELITTVYRKATDTTQILNYHSNHPMAHKRSFVRKLFQREKRTAVNQRNEYENYGIFGTNWRGMDTRTASSAAASARIHGEQTEESRQHSGTLYHIKRTCSKRWNVSLECSAWVSLTVRQRPCATTSCE
ncbi:Acyl-CoA synthetase member 2 mitochondrial [Sparganum proliferum]